MNRPIERVVVPLDAASENRTAIETAARLAARTKAPLHGVFVEDEDLLRLAGLPFARQITQQTGAMPFTPQEAELQLRAAAERARRELLAAARRHNVECSFEIVRGRAETALCLACEHDLLVVGGSTRPIARHFRLEYRWLSSIEVASAPFLLARHEWTATGSTVVMLGDLGAGSARVLDAAAQLAQARNGVLNIVCPRTIVDSAEFDKWLAKRLDGDALRLQIEVAPDSASALRETMARLDCSLLAVDAGLLQQPARGLRELVETSACDVLIVR